MTNASLVSTEVTQSHYSEAWLPFTEKLAAALATLEEDQYLIVSAKNSSHFVQFAAEGAFGLRAEAISNYYLPEGEQLTLEQDLALTTSGWESPTGNGEDSTPENDPDGSPNYYIDYPAPLDYHTVAKDAVHVLSRVHRIPHPGFLEYEAFESGGSKILLPGLGLKRAPKIPPAIKADTSSQLLASIQAETGLAGLDYDEDGNLCISYGNVPVFLSIKGTPPDVRIVATLLRDVEESERLLKRLNELNTALGKERLIVHDGTIFAVTLIPASPYVEAHVRNGLREFCPAAERLRDLLLAKFDGSPTGYAPSTSKLKH